MPLFTTYPPGTPCWVDLASPDPVASRAFYGELFGRTAVRDYSQGGRMGAAVDPHGAAFALVSFPRSE